MWGLARTKPFWGFILIPAEWKCRGAGKVRSSWGVELPLSPSSGAGAPSCLPVHEGHGGHSKEQKELNLA